MQSTVTATETGNISSIELTRCSHDTTLQQLCNQLTISSAPLA